MKAESLVRDGMSVDRVECFLLEVWLWFVSMLRLLLVLCCIGLELWY